MSRAATLILVAAIVCAPRDARGDEGECKKLDRVCLLLPTPTTIQRHTDGATRDLPPGRFLDELTWQALDAEMRRLQDAETRLTEQNRYMREKVEGWSPGWKTLAITLAAGLVLGAYGYSKIP